MKKNIFHTITVIVAFSAIGIYFYACSGSSETIFSGRTANFTTDTRDCELGTKFFTTVAGTITKVRVYTNASEVGYHSVRIWELNPNNPPSIIYKDSSWNITLTDEGWKELTLTTPLPIKANTDYIVSISSCNKSYAYGYHDFDSPGKHGYIRTYTGSGVYTYDLGSVPLLAVEYYNTGYYREIVFVPTLPQKNK